MIRVKWNDSIIKSYVSCCFNRPPRYELSVPQLDAKLSSISLETLVFLSCGSKRKHFTLPLSRFFTVSWSSNRFFCSLCLSIKAPFTTLLIGIVIKERHQVPVQLCPFPVYPGWQVQTYDPLVFVQVAFTWQEWFPLHSSISEKPLIHFALYYFIALK